MPLDPDEETICKHQIDICEHVRLCVDSLGRSDAVTQASRLLYRRTGDATQSIYILRKHAIHDWSHDGVSILRTLYDVMLQLLFMLHDPDERERRAQHYLDYLWIEKHRLRHRADSSETDVGRYLASSSKRRAAEAHLNEQLAKVGPEFLTRKGHDKFAQLGTEYLLSPDASYRPDWFSPSPSGLAGRAGLAHEVGYLKEYELFHKNTSASIHASPFALSFPTAMQPQYLLIWALEFDLRCAGALADAYDIALCEDQQELIRDARRNIYDVPGQDHSA